MSPPTQAVAGHAIAQPAAAAAPAEAVAPAAAAPAGDADAPGAVRSLWEAGREAARERSRALAERIATEPDFGKAMTAGLEARGWEFFFTTPTATAAALDLLLAALREAPEHGLRADRYPVAALDEAVSRFRAASGQAAAARAVLDADPAWQALRPLVERPSAPGAAEVEGLVDAGRVPDDDDVLDTLVKRHAEAMVADKALYRSRADVEVPAMAGFFRYALDMRFVVAAHPFRAEREPARAAEKHQDELLAAFDAFARDPAAALAALPPPHPYYAATRKALAQYRKLAAGGPFPEVSFKGKLKRGARGETVRALRARLAAEGYMAASDSAEFDQSMEDAVKDYQATHGYDPTGVLEDKHLKSLNVPVDQRVRQIELSLQRWRESEVRHEEPLYVRVNIPEFMMEVWEEGKLVQKHRVVTGNNNWDKDVDNRIEGRINRTKLFTATIKQVLLNPKWHVPGRIRREELEFEILKEPDYYARHNFKVKTLPDGREEIYQDSGHGNALGRVKFVFPNPFGIFMHDTNMKEFFKREIRAFSHGCIRLQDPLDVAFYLLEKIQGMTREEVQAVLDRRDEKQIELDRKVPIFVEYNSVGVDEDGRAVFFSDVYGYDRDWYDGKIPYSDDELKLLTRKIPKLG